MHFFGTIIAGISCAAAVLAQTTQIAFTSVPAVASSGSSYNITWGGGDGTSPVTITLREGNPSDLTTISTLTSDASGYSYTWTVSSSLPAAGDYALQITQGQSEINYSGLFSIVSGPGNSSTSSSPAVAATGSSSSRGYTNMTTSAMPLGTGASMGTAMTTMMRNTTFSSMTLTSLSPSGPLVASATSTAASSAMSTFSASQSTSAPSSGAVQITSSSVLFLAAAFAIIAFH